MRAAALLCVSLALVGCRDAPVEVIEDASQAAADGDQADFRSYFSNATIQRLRRKWALTGETAEAHWRRLAEGLTFNGQPFTEFRGESIHGEYAKVQVKAGAQQRAYFLRKEDGLWRIDLGAGQRYRLAAPTEEADAGPPKKDK